MRVPKKVWIPAALAVVGAAGRQLDKHYGSPVGNRVSRRASQAATVVTAKVAQMRQNAATGTQA